MMDGGQYLKMDIIGDAIRAKCSMVKRISNYVKRQKKFIA
jgi:hypothetical protein